MKTIQKHDFGPVTGYEFGYSPVGRPLMTVFCYGVEDVMVDTAQSHMRGPALQAAEVHGVKAILLTHHHEDHSGNAAAIKAAHRIPVYGSPEIAAKLSLPYRIFPYQRWIWGPTTPVQVDSFPAEFFERKGLKFAAIPTPGHSRDHTAYLEVHHGWLFSGDLYLGDRIKYFRADEKIKDQIDSLRHILTYEFEVLFCGHNPRLKNGKTFLAAKLRFLEDFYGNVGLLADQGAGEREIMDRLGLKEQTLIKIICFGNVSMRNMVRSAMAARAAERGN